jgi:hypothetical protein
MSKFKKFLFTAIVSVFALVSSTALVFAASGTYNTTYDMTGGVYSATTWTPTGNSTWKFQISPIIGVSGAGMTIYIEKSGFFGWSTVDSANISSTLYSDSTLYSSSTSTHRFYLRDWSGFQNTGYITLKYSW